MQDGQDALSYDEANKATSLGTTVDQSLGDPIDNKQLHFQPPNPN